MGKPQRVKINHPITQQEYEGTGEYTKEILGEYVWDITLDNGERLMLAEHEANLYQLVVLSQ
jgi:hypothetical protein